MGLGFDRAAGVVSRPVNETTYSGGFWRKDEPIIEDEQVVTGGMWPAQRAWWDGPESTKLFLGGYGAGKTFVGGKRAISLALENSGCPFGVVSPTFPMARQTTIPTIMELLAGKQQQFGQRDFSWTYNKSIHEFIIRFKGRTGIIYIYSGENPKTLKGANLSGVWLDEPFIMHRDVYLQMKARIRHPNATRREMIMTGTPEELGWGYKLCKDPPVGGKPVGVYIGSTRENKALPADYVLELLANMTPEQAEAYVDGKFVNLTEGRVYYAFDDNDNVIDLDEPEGAKLGVGIDFNVNPMTAVVFWHLNGHMHVVKEYELKRSDTELLAAKLREDHGARLIDAYPDASGARVQSSSAGRSDFTYLKEAGFKINAPFKNPLRKDRWNAVNGQLKPAINGINLTISPSCKKLIEYLSAYSHNLMNKQDYMSHLTDALGYPVHRLFGKGIMTFTQKKLEGY